jgi:hypothetical protein
MEMGMGIEEKTSDQHTPLRYTTLRETVERREPQKARSSFFTE